MQVIVNGRVKQFEGKKISFDEAVALTFGNLAKDIKTTFTVSYCKGHPKKDKGIMVAGDKIPAVEGMIFNISATDKS
jgi:hypothetical protein